MTHQLIHDAFHYDDAEHSHYLREGYCFLNPFLSDEGLAWCLQNLDRMLLCLQPGRNPVVEANTKSCRPSLSAKVALDPSELVAPGFQPAAGGVPEPKLTLYLQDSGAKGNSVFCDYASNKGDVALSTTLQCKDATPTSGVPHAYKCSP